LDPAEKWERVLDVSGIQDAVTIGDTYAVKFFTLGSVLRGVPEREWGVLFKGDSGHVLTFYPRVDVMAVAEDSMAWT